MALLTVQSAPNRSGINLTTTAVAADAGLSDWFTNDGATHFTVWNGGASPITVTINWGTNASIDGVTPSPHTVTVPNGDYTILGPFPTNIYNNTTTGFCTIAYSAVTSVKVLAYKAK